AMCTKLPPGIISRRYRRRSISFISFSWKELTVEKSRWLLVRRVSIAFTSFGEVPVPVNRRMGVLALSARTPQAVNAVTGRARETTMMIARRLDFFSLISLWPINGGGLDAAPIVFKLLQEAPGLRLRVFGALLRSHP